MKESIAITRIRYSNDFFDAKKSRLEGTRQFFMDRVRGFLSPTRLPFFPRNEHALSEQRDVVLTIARFSSTPKAVAKESAFEKIQAILAYVEQEFWASKAKESHTTTSFPVQAPQAGESHDATMFPLIRAQAEKNYDTAMSLPSNAQAEESYDAAMSPQATESHDGTISPPSQTPQDTESHGATIPSMFQALEAKESYGAKVLPPILYSESARA